MRKKVLGAAASLLASLPGTGFALGLGDIQLKSSLNAPLDAEIELVGATADELSGLKVQLASRDTFSRYGIDYPGFLSGITVRTTRVASGRTVIQLRSSAPITEPFVTVLVEANYGRGRQVREYSVLLDPPVFTAPTPAPAAPIAAPATGGADRSGQVARPAVTAPAAGSERAPATARPAATSQADGDYRVKSGDTLSGVAVKQFGSAERRQAMVAIYRGNPQAFDGNMNVLRSGAVLRLPEAAAVSSISAAEASAEIRRQSSAWQGGTAVSTSASNQLKLVPPQETKPAASTAGAATGSAVSQPAEGAQQLQQRLSELETQLADARRELEQRTAEIAKLQQPGAEPASGAAPAAAAVPAATPVPAAKPVAPKAVPVAPQSGGLLAFLKTLWYLPVGLLALAAALLGIRTLRRRREEAVDLSTALEVAADETSDSHALTDVRVTQPGPRHDETVPRLPVLNQGDSSFVVEESRQPTASTTGSTSTRLPVLKPGADHSDPIAEADFHMAYGLYDQAADLIRLSVQREPQRRDLKLKLLEILFVWGNKSEFVDMATDLYRSREQGARGEWDKILIMGRQLAPEASLFNAPDARPAPVAVDHNLEGGQNRVELDLPVSPVREAEPATLDFPLDAPLIAAVPVAHSAGSVPERKPELLADKTQELAAFDDMGLDIGTLDTALHPALADTQLQKALGLTDSTALMPALDPSNTLNRPLPMLGVAGVDDHLTLGATSEWKLLDPNSETLGMGDSSSLPGSVMSPAAPVATADLDAERTLRMESPSLSEIGTKLDLARAYIDMGDPDGARGILGEVLLEGNDAQKQEAQRLLDAIPG